MGEADECLIIDSLRRPCRIAVVVEKVGVVQQRPKLRNVGWLQDLRGCIYPLLADADERAEQTTWLKCGRVGNPRKRLKDQAQGSGHLALINRIFGSQVSGHEFMTPIMFRNAVLTDIPVGERRAGSCAN